jgi:hypothetical protein
LWDGQTLLDMGRQLSSICAKASKYSQKTADRTRYRLRDGGVLNDVALLIEVRSNVHGSIADDDATGLGPRRDENAVAHPGNQRRKAPLRTNRTTSRSLIASASAHNEAGIAAVT